MGIKEKEDLLHAPEEGHHQGGEGRVHQEGEVGDSDLSDSWRDWMRENLKIIDIFENLLLG